MKISNSQSKNVKQMKSIIQTLSKNIPNSQNDNKKFLDEFNKINTNVKALELLNKRLMDLVPKERLIKYDPYTSGSYYVVQFLNRIGGEVIPTSTEIPIILNSLYMDWSKEFDTSGNEFQYRLAFINMTRLYIRTNNSKLSSYGTEFDNYLSLGVIEEGNTNNYTEITGFIPCNIFTDNKGTTGLLYFSGTRLYLRSNDWSLLGSEDTDITIRFSGIVKYVSYDDYSPRNT